ncbi:molybdenum cofactor guanylyltransferase [Listeria sp. FSL L7-1582]|uniref:molybdenum cofactor guanylyltransferase n=1 Tax=Listeria portnoyi TaxID=2713504 RepID=UPI00164DF22C|nr:molybdenum cofactor guanylyltransferase [Listeria portnoyi]MBC6310356.1 molybdenum cofactor guanylyltransferase [Listeria portnoyi]
MSKTKTIAGIILAGGNSRRFGEDKALYKETPDSQTWVEQTADKMRPLVDHVFIVTNQRLFASIDSLFPDADTTVFSDKEPFLDKGPLGGIHAVMDASHYERYLLTPTDTPQITTAIFAELIHQGNAYAATKTADHYLTACIPHCKTEIEAMLRDDNLRIRQLLQTIGTQKKLFQSDTPFQNRNYK